MFVLSDLNTHDSPQTSKPHNKPTTDRRKQAVLADPLFLQHHVWMGLEKERLELLTAHVKAQSHRCVPTPCTIINHANTDAPP